MKSNAPNFFALPVALLLANTGMAQTPSARNSPLLQPGSPRSVGVSQERLDRIDKLCKDAVASGKVPGVVALVSRKGKIVFEQAYGMADNQANVKLKTDTIFRIASQSKAVTSTALLTLWEQGLFRLDDPISRFIPEFKNPQVLKSYNDADGTYTSEPAKREITFRDILTHTSGLGYGVIDGDERFRKIYAKAGVTDLFTTDNVTIGQSVKKLAKLPLHHNPGEKFTYSEGLDVAGYLIEILSGETFDHYLHSHIFEPLHMVDSGFYLPAEKAYRLVAVQKPENGSWVRYPITFYDPDYPIKGAKSFFSGGAGLCSTARDYANFLQMWLNGGELNGARILSRTTVRMALGQQVASELFGGGNSYFSLAFSVTTAKGEITGGSNSAGTFDWGGYFNTQYFADPKEQMIGILMKQTQGGNDDTAWKFRILMTQSIDD